MSVIIVVVLHQLLVLDVAILLLNGVKLVSKSNVIFVALLDLEDLCLQLGDEQVFLVACKVDGIVILSRVRREKYLPWPF